MLFLLCVEVSWQDVVQHGSATVLCCWLQCAVCLHVRVLWQSSNRALPVFTCYEASEGHTAMLACTVWGPVFCQVLLQSLFHRMAIGEPSCSALPQLVWWQQPCGLEQEPVFVQGLPTSALSVITRLVQCMSGQLVRCWLGEVSLYFLGLSCMHVAAWELVAVCCLIGHGCPNDFQCSECLCVAGVTAFECLCPNPAQFLAAVCVCSILGGHDSPICGKLACRALSNYWGE